MQGDAQGNRPGEQDHKLNEINEGETQGPAQGTLVPPGAMKQGMPTGNRHFNRNWM